ncbi:hypothetical protein PHYSODRAFT_293088 [Phytophthora sojae]|uniref:Uncharacterized protein n=1 Tax=Phytophthora sojae (strain P6497) TaxID=1094619 RepID=G4YFH3_PHYSP|nr:hypothetical protein PHYSODRAFT_293088 [Phytophthora sojae]EGZ26958.1 hypothetical protein PHYSODRAFT_293088 [Phytophthora sojae]|eukprot:XP_009514233.1 hypothetical protein PHYSODRAFT_293088 [Phytophthora sojae]
MNRLRRTFLKLHLGLGADSKKLMREHPAAGDYEEKRIDKKLPGTRELGCHGSLAEWGHAVDSLYAVRRLTDSFSEDKLIEFYNWASSANHSSLAAGLNEIYMYRMAPAALRIGWRDDTKSTYWSTGYHHVHNIDAIVKLAPTSGKTGTVAYLDVVANTSHVVDAEKLRELNEIFCQGSETTGGTPVYVALCPNESACKTLSLKPHDQVVAAQTMCRVCVGYCPTLLATSMPPSREKRSPSESELCSEPRKQQKTSGFCAAWTRTALANGAFDSNYAFHGNNATHSEHVRALW